MRLFALTLGMLLAAAPAHATLVDFTAVTLGPSNTLVIDGVTITATGQTIRSDNGTTFIDDNPQVATAFGEGLGLVGIGADSAIDRVLTWDEGAAYNQVASGLQDATMMITVDGTINSFTFLPTLTILDGPTPDVLPRFEMSYVPKSLGMATLPVYRMVQPGTPVTVTFRAETLPYELFAVGLSSDFGQTLNFINFREAFGSPASSIQFGYSILSLDYTPTQAVPEPSALALFIPAAFVLLRRKRQ